MKCHILFSGKNKKNISKCRLLKILPRVLSVNNFRTVQILAPAKSMQCKYFYYFFKMSVGTH